ncbi:MAG: ferrous iron transporter B [Pseudobdellovibrionaceae bacterium]
MRSCVALVGAPNSGKTTLYNWLTASHFRTVNYPGATVEYSLGSLAERYTAEQKNNISVMDTPGTYSLFPKSADEEVTKKALYQHPELGPIQKVILVVDGTQMARHLLMAMQLREAGFSFIIALTMSDLLRKKDIQLNLQILEKEFATSVILVDGILGSGVQDLANYCLSSNTPSTKPQILTDWNEATLTAKVQRCEDLEKQVIQGSKGTFNQIYAKTAQIDRWLLHPTWGLLLFFIIMWGLFSSIYWGAAPLMDLVDGFFSSSKDYVVALAPDSLWADFLGNGVVASFGAVLIFVPQIFILFFLIGLLESSGYLARAATLIDRPFSKIGLSGRSFVPVLSGFACAVPAIMATRNISSARDRWITNFIIPLMSCSARLPVYALLLGFLFKDQSSWKAGLALAGLYFFAIFIGALAAGILNKILKNNEVSLFLMELPMYRPPQVKVILHQTLIRTKAYVKRAGPVIFFFAVVIWLGTTFPNYKAEDAVRLETSYLSVVGQKIEPLFTPMGVDWRVGVGLLSAFAAREVFVSSLALMFNITGDEEAQAQGLQATMAQAHFPNGDLIFTPATVIGLLVFFVIALQCMTTFAIQVKENKSWSFAVTQLILFNAVAYVLAVAIVQVSKFIF